MDDILVDIYFKINKNYIKIKIYFAYYDLQNKYSYPSLQNVIVFEFLFVNRILCSFV